MGSIGAQWALQDDGGFVDNRKPEGEIITNDTLSREAFRVPPGQADTEEPLQTIPDNTIRFESPDGDVTTVPADRFWLPNGSGSSVLDESLFQGALIDAKGTKSIGKDPTNWNKDKPPQPPVYGIPSKTYTILIINVASGAIQTTAGPFPGPIVIRSIEPFNTYYWAVYGTSNSPPQDRTFANTIIGSYYPPFPGTPPNVRVIDASTGLDVNKNPSTPTFNLSVGSGKGAAASLAGSGMPGYPDPESGDLASGLLDALINSSATSAGEFYSEMFDDGSGDTVSSSPGSGQITLNDAASGKTTFVSTGLSKNAGINATPSGGARQQCPDVDLTPVLEALATLQQLADKIYAVEGGDAWSS